MALNIDYVVRETGRNLRRNLTITVASVLCVTVSLSLVGAAFMVRQGVERATQRWQGGIEFIVFMNATATEEQLDAVERGLESSPEVASFSFVDQEAAYEEFRELFSDTPEMVESVTPEILPPSFRVEPVGKDTESVTEVAAQFSAQAGVEQVVTSTETIRVIQTLSNTLTSWGLRVAVVLLIVAVLIILTTIQLAIFTRRREIEVMKLVGASNSFIRVPFMLEGLVQGLVGALLAIGALAAFKGPFEDSLPSPEEFPLFSAFSIANVEMLGTYILLGAVGMGIGTAAAAIAVTWFLDV